jgi:hypothetical protein
MRDISNVPESKVKSQDVYGKKVNTSKDELQRERPLRRTALSFFRREHAEGLPPSRHGRAASVIFLARPTAILNQDHRRYGKRRDDEAHVVVRLAHHLCLVVQAA